MKYKKEDEVRRETEYRLKEIALRRKFCIIVEVSTQNVNE